jgi:hypothetical protein
MRRVETSPCAGLPVIVEACGPPEIHTVVGLPLDRECGVQNTGIAEMGPG